ncbi:ribonuclease T2 family protein [Mycolicibacterium stellerae]|uniref:ribonuclease T2 family protein n=1 Tax=Mycolicibacterium stellerae TaxID=2358193 RepID=UPI000F0B51CA|nr:ribonuclease T(2) [Mycolicibacterium stellerae]
MRRGDVVVLSISCVLTAIAVAAVTFSVRVLDHTPSGAEFDSAQSGSSWLVLTWGPSLCAAEPTNAGCTSGHVGTQGPTWLLHGLWPQPADNQYCGVPKEIARRASDLKGSHMPSVDIGGDVRSTLRSLMSDEASLAPHEWYAHGTCSGVSPDVFFSDAAALTEQARKVLDPMFTEAQGGRIALSDVRDKFDREYGAGAGDRLRLSCRNVTGQGGVVYELHLSLPSVTEISGPDGTRPLKDLILDGPPLGQGCRNASVP